VHLNNQSFFTIARHLENIGMKELAPEKVFMGFAILSGAGLLRAAAFEP